MSRLIKNAIFSSKWEYFPQTWELHWGDKNTVLSTRKFFADLWGYIIVPQDNSRPWEKHTDSLYSHFLLSFLPLSCSMNTLNMLFFDYFNRRQILLNVNSWRNNQKFNIVLYLTHQHKIRILQNLSKQCIRSHFTFFFGLFTF
jgi:hypothetical protein